MKSTERLGGYDFAAIEERWQRYWSEKQTFRTLNPGEPGWCSDKPKFFILDFFPYPSGAGLHVGHPLGYCATDIIARYKRMRGFNVLHPMGFDAFGLPAEQYAIETGVHPAVTTKNNIATFRRQLQMFGFSYDWHRELTTCDPSYYKFTQWIFLRLFDSWYDTGAEWIVPDAKRATGLARPISELISALEKGEIAPRVNPSAAEFSGQSATGQKIRPAPRSWEEAGTGQQRQIIDSYRLAYLADVRVNWCPALGTVLANEEVDNEGRSDRGGHPVFRKVLRQWMLRITAYADRLLTELDDLDWPEPIKLMQRNWIGRSTGAEVVFPLADQWTIENGQWKSTSGQGEGPPSFNNFPGSIRVFTTRPDTLFGATYMVLAPEHKLVEQITTSSQREAVETYVAAAKNRSERDRTADTKAKTGVFTGAYAINPVNGTRVPIWTADYVLMGYGTGAIMAVPGHDARDFEFAKAFDLPIVAVVQADDSWFHEQINSGAIDGEYCTRKGKEALAQQIMDSATFAAGTLGGITAQDATAILDGDPGWVRQVLLPAYVDDPGIFIASFDGEGHSVNSPSKRVPAPPGMNVCDLNGLPTAQAKAKITEWLEAGGVGRAAINYKLHDWIFSRQKYWGEPFPVLHSEGNDRETIGLSDDELPIELPEMEDFKPTPVADRADSPPEPPLGRATEWKDVERDGRGYVRDLNTMPQWAGSCWYYLRFIDPHNEQRFCGKEAERYWMPVDLYVGGAEHAVLHLLYARFWHKLLFDLGLVSTPEPFGKLFNQGMIQGFAYEDSRGIRVSRDQIEEPGENQYVLKSTGEPVKRIIAKMSKSLKNVVSPDEIITQYGADTFRLYEMYMGPLESSKPWNTRDVPGLFKLCQRVWRLVVDENTGELAGALTDREPEADELRALHKAIQRVTEDLEQLKLNTAIAAVFDFVNFMTPRSSRPRAVIEPFILLLSPFAPHVAEELWHRLGHDETLAYEPWPVCDEKLARDEQVEIGVQVGGKVRARIMVAADADEETIRTAALDNDRVVAALVGKTIRKVIVVKGRLVNIVAN